MPPKRPTKKHSNGHKSKSTPSKSPQAISQLKHRANGSKLDYIVNARDVMSLKFVRTASDLESLDGFFSPVYVHQLFTNEKIIGYKDLQIRVFFSQPALHCYIEIEYNEKLKYDDTTDIVNVFKKWIMAGFTQNKQQFIKKLGEEFIPFGELQCQFIRPDNDNNDININNNTNNKDTDDESNDESSDSIQSEQLSPRNARLLRRKRRLNEINNSKEENNESDHDRPRKRRKLMIKKHNDSSSENELSDCDSFNDSDAEDQKKDCIQSNDCDIFNNKNNAILNSKFNEFEYEIYEIRIGSFEDEHMREFHLRLQFFVLLYIESSSFLDETDEIWEVMVIFKRNSNGLYQTLGYLTLYKFYAFPDKKRLRVSQVIIFPPFQRKGLGFEALQHVYLMAKYRDFIEVNVEDPGEGFQKLRDTTDIYNACKNKCYNNSDFKVNHLTTYHKTIIYNNNNNNHNNNKNEYKSESEHNESESENESYSANTKKNKKNMMMNKKPLIPFISQHKKISSDIYHSAIMNCHKQLKITPEQARVAYECLKLEYTNKIMNKKGMIKNDENLQWKLYKLDVKRRLYALLNTEGALNYDDSAIFARLQQEFNATIDRYERIIKKRNEWLKTLNDWDKTHEYPLWIKKKLNPIKDKDKHKNINLNKKKAKYKKRRR